MADLERDAVMADLYNEISSSDEDEEETKLATPPKVADAEQKAVLDELYKEEEEEA